MMQTAMERALREINAVEEGAPDRQTARERLRELKVEVEHRIAAPKPRAKEAK